MAQAADLQTEYAGKRVPLFRLALVSSFFTVVTLGFYRFWMKTRLRRFYWSAIRPGGQPLEYTGEALEKLLGFLIAVVFLAFYIGIVNLILVFLSFSLLNNNLWAYALSFVGVLPVLFYARYRARRYILARTRWRGIRFGMDGGAWGYSWRAIVHWLVALVTLGLLWPRMTFALEKYRTDRTWYGSQPMHQGGRWQMLMRPFLPVILGVAVVSGGVAYAIFAQNGAGAIASLAGVALVLYGLVHYSVNSFRIMANNKTVGNMRFVAHPRPWRVAQILVFGYGLVFASLAALMVALAIAVFIYATSRGGSGSQVDLLALGQELPLWVNTLIAAMVYFGGFILWGVFKHVFVTMPIARHYAQTLTITNPAHLSGIVQRARDEMEHADGFAEALDVGAAI